jgi:hypothetical protein
MQEREGEDGHEDLHGHVRGRQRLQGKEACVAKRDGRAATDLRNAAKACKAERAADAAAFTKKYGTNKNGKNAYGKCVSAKAREATEQETKARANARQDLQEAEG